MVQSREQATRYVQFDIITREEMALQYRHQSARHGVKVEVSGGMAEAVVAAWPKPVIEEAAARQARIDLRGETIVA